MKRWIAALIGGIALSGIAVTSAVYAAPFITALSDTASPNATSTGSSGSVAIEPPVDSTKTTDLHGSGGGTTTLAAPQLPSAENPWSGNVLVPDELNDQIVQAETALIAPCMAASGFAYLAPSPANTSMFPPGLTESQQLEYAIALDGDWSGTYDWTRAGCRGAAVHALGMDNAH